MPGNQSKIDALLQQVQQGEALSSGGIATRGSCCIFHDQYPKGTVPDLSDIREPSIVTGLLKAHLVRATNAVVPIAYHTVRASECGDAGEAL